MKLVLQGRMLRAMTRAPHLHMMDARQMGLDSSIFFGIKVTVDSVHRLGSWPKVSTLFHSLAAAHQKVSGSRCRCSGSQPSGPGALPNMALLAARKASASTDKLTSVASGRGIDSKMFFRSKPTLLGRLGLAVHFFPHIVACCVRKETGWIACGAFCTVW